MTTNHEPAWRDAVAVIAKSHLAESQVWRPDSEGTYYGTEGDVADDYELSDITPLIEMKVTDEMVERGRNIGAKGEKPDAEMVRRILASAFGLETY